MTTVSDLIVMICRVMDQATDSWSHALRMALVLSAASAPPIAIVVLIVLLR